LDDAVREVTTCIIKAAEASVPQSSSRLPIRPKIWWNEDCKRAKRLQRTAWNRFRRYPTSQNQRAFQHARAAARRVRRKAERESWRKYVTSINSSTPTKVVWNQIKKMRGNNCSYSMSIMIQNGVPITNFMNMANLLGEHFASVSSSDSYDPS